MFKCMLQIHLVLERKAVWNIKPKLIFKAEFSIRRTVVKNKLRAE